MATDILRPVIQDINSTLTEPERKEAFRRFCAVYGNKYSNQKNLLSLLYQCVKENKISPVNTLPLREGLTSDPERKRVICGIVEQFKRGKTPAIEEWLKHQPREFVGRDLEWFGNIVESQDCVILWGASGVGKTKLAYTYMRSRNDIDHKVLDLRNIKSMEVIYVETLKQFGKLVSIEDASQVLVANVIKNYVMSKRSLLLLDNADDFVHYPGEGIDLTSEFASLVKSILEESSHHNLKVIITSLQQSVHPDASLLHQEQLMPLRPEDASEIIKSRMLHERDKDSKQTNKNVMKAVEQCKGLPLSLKVLGAALQEQGSTLKSILPIIKKKADEKKVEKQAERVELPEEDICTYAVLASRFEQLSDTLQLAGVALSLFTRTFSLKSVAAVLSDCEVSKIHLILNYLEEINFVNGENESVYDMHPTVREFLIGQISSTPMMKEYYVKAKQNFTAYYREELTSLAPLVDENYIRAYGVYLESSSDFDFVFGEKNDEYILVDNFDDNQNIVSLLHHMIKPEERLKLFENFTETALKRGKILLGIQYLCHTVMARSFFNPLETLKFSLLRVRHMLEAIGEECTSRSRKKQLDHLYGLYYYVRGEVLYRMIRVNFSLSDCETAKDSLEKSIDIRERLEPGGSTEIVRSYIVLGNIYNMTEDVQRRDGNFDKTEPLLAKALDVYNGALELCKKLSPSGLHVDLPQIESNIGTIWSQRGLLLQQKDERDGRSDESKEAQECFAKAEECFKQSLETEKKLKLDGLYETSVKLVNMGDVQGYIRKFEDAVNSLVEALELRRMFKGDHEDTVLVLYKLGNLSMQMKKFKEAAEYYKEAFEMDERLPKDFHSAVRKQIRQCLVSAYQSWSSQMEEQYNIEEAEQLTRDRVEVEKRIKQLEEKEEKEAQGAAEEAKNVAGGLEPNGDRNFDPPERDFQTSMAACDKFVDGEFNEKGGHVSFKYINASLSIPRNLTKDTQAVRIYCMREEDVHLTLGDSEFLVSDVIKVDSEFSGTLKSPAMLEIRCNVLDSRIEKSFELFMMEYNPVSKQWIDVEKTACVKRRFYWYNKSDHVPIIQGWINRFSMFAAVVRPKRNSFSVPPSGLVWRPAEDGRISLAFPSGCFIKDADTSCIVKLVHPEQGVVKKAQEERGLLLSPAINVRAKENIAKAITVSLPLSDSSNKQKKRGFLKVLKKEDDNTSEFEVDDLNPVFKDGDKIVVKVEVCGFSWLMAVWTQKEVDAERLKWIDAMMFRHFQYDVNVDVFKKTAVDHSVMIGVSCTPVKTSDEHWQERLKNLRVSGYEYVNSAPAEERLVDGALIRIIVNGQFSVADSEKSSFRFISGNFSPTQIVLKENSRMRKERWIHFDKVENEARLCSVPYHKDFKLVSDSDAEHAARERNKPVRFLGMKLDKCDLECLHVHPSSFRNILYKTGLDDAFIEQLKLGCEQHAQRMVVTQVLDEITRLFVKDDLTQDWFSVFETSAHPDSLRKNLSSVIGILYNRLIDRDWKKIEADIESENENSGFLQNLASRLQEVDREPRLDFKESMQEYVAKKHTLVDLIKMILLVQSDGYIDEAFNVLDKIGRIVENWMPCIHY